MSEFNIKTEEKTKKTTYHTVSIDGVKFDEAETLGKILEYLLEGGGLEFQDESLKEGLLELSFIEKGYRGKYIINRDKEFEIRELISELSDIIS